MAFLEQLAAGKGKLKKTEKCEALALQPLRFDAASARWLPVEVGTAQGPEQDVIGSAPPPTMLRCLSFNIMKEKEHLQPRMAALLALVESADPDFICLQENTEEHNDLLCASGFVRENYLRSGFEGQEHGFKVSLFSKYPFLRNGGLMLYDLAGRPCVTGYVALPGAGEGVLGISSVHLTSGNNSGVRQKQLQALYKHTIACTTSLVCGDFNAAKPLEDDVAVEQLGFTDVWPLLHPAGRGASFRSLRLDRAALRSTVYEAHAMDIIGSEAVQGAGDDEHVTISDHLGFVVTVAAKVQDAEGCLKPPSVPSSKELSQKRYRLNTVDDKPEAGGVKEADPVVVEIYSKVWEEHAGDKAKICAKLGLDAAEWTDGLDKDSFIKKFVG